MSNSNILKIGSLLNKFPNNGSKIELSKELKDKLVSVVSAYGKSNSDKDRDIIKDKTGKGNDFQILNAGYKLNSSFGKYEEDFTSWRIYPNIKVTDNVITTNGNFNSTWFIYKHSNEKEINEMNIKVSGIPEGEIIRYFYIPDETATMPVSYNISEDGVYHLPKSKLSSNRVSVGFTVSSSYDWNNIRIEQIPLFKGAFTTDGIDDLIMSQKSVSDMLDGSNEYTVLSMIHHIDVPEGNRYSNVIRIKLNSWGVSNKITSSSNNKTGIYGYTVKDTSVTIINNILGDKNDYGIRNGTDTSNLAAKFSVIGWIGEDDIVRENSSVAWYWTVIAKAVLTTDEINQVIAYYNLDRPGEIVKPDILYDVKRQGITNENHAEFNDELIDFSGNNYNLKLYNMLWDKQSGIGNYPISFKDYTYVPSRATVQVNKNSFTITSNSNTGNFLEVNTKNKTLPIYKVKVEGTNTITNGELSYRFNNTEGVISRMSIPEDGEYEIPESPSTVNSVYSGWCINGGTNDNLNIKITLLPTDDITNAVVLDGISSFGKVSNIPILKDYTVAAFRKWLYGDSVTSTETGSIVSKSKVGNNGAFIFEQTLNRNPPRSSTFSFGTINSLMSNDKLFEESFTYQTKYSYNGNSIQPGTGVDSDSMWLGLIRDNDARYSKMAIWSLLLFPYSLSEFLLERQLKKYKLGTLYPNMVEWRPIVSSNTEYQSILYFNKADGKNMVVGQYYPADTSIQISILPTQPNKVNKITVNGKEPIFLNNKDGIYRYEWHFDDKSPQQIKLKLGIDENLVKWNPIITTNVELKIEPTFVIRGTSTLLKIGDYIPKNSEIWVVVTMNNLIDELRQFSINGIYIPIPNSGYNPVTGKYGFPFVIDNKSPQNINLTIDEYIKFEDIVQPYPVVLTFRDINANEVYSWGSKIKVGSSIRVNTITNIIPELYSINSYKYGETYYSYRDFIALIFEVTRQSLEFSIRKTYKLGNNEPKTILSPERLSIPNSIYKILGYIPDLTGNGNHGKINNSTYVGMSGVNGYGTNLGNWSINSASFGKIITQREEYLKYEVLSADKNLLFYNTKVENDTFVIYASVNTHITYSKESDIIANIPANIPTKVICPKVGTILLITDETPAVGSMITVQQEGLYEGAYCLDGVDDYISIPTLVTKQSLIKCNWTTENYNKFLLDYRKDNASNGYSTNKTGSSDTQLAYNGRVTYIDGILNKNLIPDDNLKGITHCAVTQYPSNIESETTIASAFDLRGYMQMALYTYIAFSEFSTDEEIKQLNDIIGIEGNFVEWNPTVTANVSTYVFVPRIRKSDSTIINLVKGNIYSTSITGNLVSDIVPPNKVLDEVSNVIIDGISYTPIKNSSNDYYRVEIPLVFPQEINITIDEYIRYETIEQPYPIFLNYIDKETNKAYTWGDKVKVDSILKISGYKNLFENGEISLGGSNGYSINGSSELVALGTLLTSEILVNKINTGVKSSVIWNLDTPKPLFAYDPSIINNIGLKNLGYLPDITGQGRHLLLDGFAYEGMSGVNGYPVVLGVNKTWTNIITSDGIIWNYKLTSTSISIYKSDPSGSFLIRTWVISNGVINSVTIPEFKIKISNLKDGEIVQYHYVSNDNNSVVSFVSLKTNGIHTLPASVPIVTEDVSTNKSIGFTFKLNNNANVDGLTIEVLSNYEGSLYFDGVNDYGTVQNLTYGGKCLISKLNYNLKSSIIYDQRSTLDNTPDTNTFALYIGNNNNNVYSERLTGDVYINNVLNNYIGNTDLNNNTHVVTATCSIVDSSNSISPIFGRSKTGSTYAQFAMYRTILLPEIPSDADRTTINNWVGIEAKVELPSYYWDAYGKTNLDADRKYIKDQVSLQLNNDNTNNNSLENFNFGYEGMSGYNGYPVVFGNQKTWNYLRPESDDWKYGLSPTSITIYKALSTSALLFTIVREVNGTIRAISIPSFKINVEGLKSGENIRYRYISSDDTSTYADITITENGQHELPASAPIEVTETTPNSFFVGFQVKLNDNTSAKGLIIKILPEYSNGLILDGVNDYMDNANIPVFRDYTYIIKYADLDTLTPNSCIQRKGETKLGGGAFVHSYISAENKEFQLSFGASNGNLTNTDPIQYCTKTNYNGTIIKAGTNTDDLGITIGKWNQYRKMVFYKEMLWSKSLSSYEINMIRNLMMQDDIIDLNNLIFKK